MCAILRSKSCASSSPDATGPTMVYISASVRPRPKRRASQGQGPRVGASTVTDIHAPPIATLSVNTVISGRACMDESDQRALAFIHRLRTALESVSKSDTVDHPDVLRLIALVQHDLRTLEEDTPARQAAWLDAEDESDRAQLYLDDVTTVWPSDTVRDGLKAVLLQSPCSLQRVQFGTGPINPFRPSSVNLILE